MIIRKALLKDVETIFELANFYADQGLMLKKSRFQLCENIRDFMVAEEDGQVVGAAALHILGEDLAEVRTTAVAESQKRKGVGKKLVNALLEEGKAMGVAKAFTLTYQPEFFASCGFDFEDKMNMPQKVWTDCINCPKFPNCDENCMSKLL